VRAFENIALIDAQQDVAHIDAAQVAGARANDLGNSCGNAETVATLDCKAIPDFGAGNDEFERIASGVDGGREL
jgi:hypothetical protein